MTKTQFENVVKWQDKTFPSATCLSKIYHLKEEVQELIRDVETGGPHRRLEFADCFLLLFGAAKKDGMSYQDICNAIDEKMEICKKRKWGEPDKNGVVKHLKD